MTTKTITLTIAKVLEGAAVDESMPAGWLNSFYERARKAIPESEWNSAQVLNAQGISISYEHALTKEEEMQDMLADYATRAEAIRRMLPRDGETLSAEAVKAIRAIVDRR